MFKSCLNRRSNQEGEEHDDAEPLDPLNVQKALIENAIKQVHEFIDDKSEELFKNNQEFLEERVETDIISHSEVSVGPGETEYHMAYGDFIFGASASSYPKKVNKNGQKSSSKERLGDPICDCYGFEVVGTHQAVVSLADGCNWGPRPLEAARVAVTYFHKYVKKNLHTVTTVREGGFLLLHALAEAQRKILSAPVKRGLDIMEAGTTTLLGGIVLPLASDSALDESHVFICTSIGDCKAFQITSEGSVTDMTMGTRPPSAVTNVNDPGGRLGPYGKEGVPDLRNLSVFIWPCSRSDIVILASDGVYDNLDPQQLGITPAEAGLDVELWEEASAAAAEKAKDNHRVEMISNFVLEAAGEEVYGAKKKKHKKDLTEALRLEDLTNKLLENTMTVTKYSRRWMQEHPTARMPDSRSKKKDPQMLGKMDHTTVLALRVDCPLLTDSSD